MTLPFGIDVLDNATLQASCIHVVTIVSTLVPTPMHAREDWTGLHFFAHAMGHEKTYSTDSDYHCSTKITETYSNHIRLKTNTFNCRCVRRDSLSYALTVWQKMSDLIIALK